MKGFGLPGNMQDLMRQAQKVQEDIKKVQEDSESIVMDGSAAGGTVKAFVNGKMELTKLIIDPQLIGAGEVSLVEDSVIAAVNEAVRKVQGELKRRMAQVTGGLDIPGLT